MFAIDDVWLHRYPMDSIHFPAHFSIFCHANNKNYTVLKTVKDAITCFTSHSIWVFWVTFYFILVFSSFTVLDCEHWKFYAVTLNAIRMKYHNEAFISLSLLQRWHNFRTKTVFIESEPNICCKIFRTFEIVRNALKTNFESKFEKKRFCPKIVRLPPLACCWTQ